MNELGLAAVPGAELTEVFVVITMQRYAQAYVDLMERLGAWVGHLCALMILCACLVCSGNAVLRYALNMGSNAWLEAQWYLFATAVLLGSARLLSLNEHVRVDVFYGQCSVRAKACIDLLGFIFIFMPVCFGVVHLSLNFVHDAWVEHELSANAGGLLRWPIKAMIPLGYGLLLAQGLAEIIKRVQCLLGVGGTDLHYERPAQ